MLRVWPITLCLAVAYFLTGYAGLMLPAAGSHITLVWLPTGIAVAVLHRWGFRCWPGVIIGALTVNLAIGSSFPLFLGIALGNTLGPLLATGILVRSGFQRDLKRSQDILLLTVAAMVGMLVTASVGVTSLKLAGQLSDGPLSAWLIWWAGDVTGVIAVAPLILVTSRSELRRLWGRRIEFICWVASITLSIAVVFFFNGAKGPALAIAFIPFPLLVWAAIRFGPIGTSLGVISLSFGAVVGTSAGYGPFYGSVPTDSVLTLSLFMATSAVVSWLVSSLTVSQLEAVGTKRILESALEEVSFGVLVAGVDRRITYANSGFMRLTGYSEAEMLGKSCAVLQGPDTDPIISGALKAALHGPGNFDGDILNYRKDGSTFWNALLITPLIDEHGEKTGFLGIQRDVTDRKRGQFALSQSEERFRMYIDHAPNGVFVIDSHGRYTDVNPAACRQTGYGRDELLSMGIIDLTPREAVAQSWKAFEKLKADGMVEYEQPLRCKSGATRWFALAAARLSNGDFIGFTSDIQSLKESESALRQSRDRFEYLVSSCPAVIYTARPFGDYPTTSISENVRSLLGYEPEQFLSDPDFRASRIHPDDAAGILTGLPTLLESGRYRHEYRFRSSTGEYRWLDDEMVLSRDAAGEPGEIIGYLIDITARKHADEALQENETRLRLALAAASQGLYDLNVQTGECLVSPEYAIMLGYDPAVFRETNSDWRERLHPDDREAVYNIYAEYVAGQRDEYRVEFRQRTKSGEWKWILSVGAVVARTADGQPLRMLGTRTDISARKRVEEQLRQSNAILHALTNVQREFLVDAAPSQSFERLLKLLLEQTESQYGFIGQVLHSADGEPYLKTHAITNIAWDDATRALCEQSAPEGLEFNSLKNLFGEVITSRQAVVRNNPGNDPRRGGLPPGHPQLEAYLGLPLFHGTELIGMVGLAKRPDGYDDRIVEAIQPILATCAGLVLAYRLQTDQRTAAAALRESEARYRTLIETSTDAIFMLDNTGRIRSANAAAARMHGYTMDEMLAMRIQDLDDPESAAQSTDRIRRLLNGDVITFEVIHRRKDGSTFPLEVLASATQIDGEWMVLAFDRDITDRRLAEEREAAHVLRLKQLAELSLTLSGEPSTIFGRVVSMIGELFAVRVVCLSEIVGDHLMFRAVYADGQVFADAGECPLDITPCATVEDTRDVRVFDFVAERFPQATFLRQHQAHSYCGFPSLNNEGRVVAVTCLLDDKPHDFTEEDKQILRIIGQRLAAELDRGAAAAERRRADATLEDAVRRQRLALDAGRMGTWEWEIGSDHLAWDEREQLLFGFEPGAFDCRVDTFLDLVHSDDLPGVRQIFSDAAAGKEFDEEFRIRLPSGDVRWIHGSGIIVPKSDHRPPRLVGINYDITERKRAEETVRRILDGIAPRTGREFFRVLVDYLCNVCETEYAFVGALDPHSPSRVRTIAVSHRGQAVDNFSYDLQDTPCEQVVRHSICSYPSGVQSRFPHDTMLVDMGIDSYLGTPLWSSSSQPLGLIVLLGKRPLANPEQAEVVLKVVAARAGAELERQQADAALRESEERLRIFVENAPAGVAMFDRELRYLSYSRRWLTDYGLGEQSLVGRSHYDVFPEIPDRWKEIHRRCLTGVPERCEQDRLERADGTADYLRWELQPWTDATGEIGGLVLFTESITDRVNAQEQLRASLREKESMLKEIHHRVKNNLQVISSLLSLQAASVTQPDALDVLAESQNRVRAMALVHETLYRSGDLAEVDLSRYLGELCGYLFRSYGVDPARVRLEVDVEAVNVSLDKTIPCGLLVNEIVSNSLKHGFPGNRSGHITVRARTEQDGRLRLTLADDGIGLPTDLVIDQTSSLGLKLIQILAEQLGGELTIERTAGTGFVLFFSR